MTHGHELKAGNVGSRVVQGGGVETGGRWGGLGIRLGWGEKAENCT